MTTFRIELQEQLLFESNVSVQFRGKLEARLVASVAGVPIGASGQLRASLLMDGRVLGSFYCLVDPPNAPLQLNLQPFAPQTR